MRSRWWNARDLLAREAVRDGRRVGFCEWDGFAGVVTKFYGEYFYCSCVVNLAVFFSFDLLGARTGTLCSFREDENEIETSELIF